MMTKAPTNPPLVPDGIRPGVLLALLLVVAAAVAVLILLREHKPFLLSAQLPRQSGGLGQTNVPADAPVQIPAPSLTPLHPAREVADLATTHLIEQLFDASLSLKVRSQAAHALATLGTDAALAALKSALAYNSPAYLKAVIAKELGNDPNPAARALLNDLINDKNEIIARGAVRGMALSGDSDAVNALGGLLLNEQVPLSIRAEAALALGDVQAPDALNTLMSAAAGIKDDDVLENVLDGLGKRPFSETEGFFSSYLSSPEVPADSKVEAIEALGDAPGDVAPFLLKYLGDQDTDLRAAAAWALSTSESADDIGPQLMDALNQETDPNVRTRIYQALGNQPGADPEAMLPLIQNESNTSARLAGLTFLAGTVRSSPAPEVADFFNQTAIPELKNVALKSDSSQNRLTSVIALELAGTTAATGALQEIAQQSTDPNVVSSVQRMLSNPPRH